MSPVNGRYSNSYEIKPNNIDSSNETEVIPSLEGIEIKLLDENGLVISNGK